MRAELATIVDQLETEDPSLKPQKPNEPTTTDNISSLEKLHDAAYQHLVDKTPWHERSILLRAKAGDLGLNIRDKDLAAVVATSRAKLRGQKDGISPGDVFEIPEIS